MTKSSKQELKTKAAYNARPDVMAKRVQTNKARRRAEREGLVSKGDGKEVDHKKMLDKGGSNDRSNTRVVSRAANRAWRAEHPEAYGKKK